MNEVKLKLDGKEYVFALGLGFFGEVTEETGVIFEDIFEKIESFVIWIVNL